MEKKISDEMARDMDALLFADDDRREQIQQSSMFFWWPKVAGLPLLNVPETIMCRADYGVLLDCIDSGRQNEEFRNVKETIISAGDRIGWPIFLRTDQLSAKHGWQDTCHCPGPDRVASSMFELIEATAMTFELPLYGFAVRELLPLNAHFKAFHGRMPIAREFRVFIDGECIDHIQPYWPPSSIEKPDAENWERTLAMANTLDRWDEGTIRGMAVAVGWAMGDKAWSVDFAQHEDGRWFLIDMARGECSYRWDPANPPERHELSGECIIQKKAAG